MVYWLLKIGFFYTGYKKKPLTPHSHVGWRDFPVHNWNMFHFVVSSSKNRKWHIAFFVLSFSCSTYSKLCKSRYVKRNQNCNLHIIFFINKIKDFYIYTTERTKEVPNKRSKAGKKKSEFFTMGILSMSWPNPAWDYESNINDNTQAKSLAAQVRTAFVRE